MCLSLTENDEIILYSADLLFYVQLFKIKVSNFPGFLSSILPKSICFNLLTTFIRLQKNK